MINNYRKINRVAADRALAEEEETMQQDEEQPQEPDQAGAAVQNLGGGGNAGTGQGMQLTTSMPMFNGTDKIQITYEHRHGYNFRNGGSGAWKNWIFDPTAANSSPAYRYIWTDYLAIPSHMLGFYMTPFELYDFLNPRYRTWRIKNCGFRIESIQVKPNTQIGGTDLKWQNINPPAPLMGVPMVNGRNYPYWMMYEQDNYGPGAEDTDPECPTGLQFANEVNRPPYRMGFAYEAVKPAGSDTIPAQQSFTANDTPYSQRDLMYKAAPEWVGYTHQCKPWRGAHQSCAFPTQNYKNANGVFAIYDAGTHQTGIAALQSSPGESVSKTDVRSHANGTPINAIIDYDSVTTPVFNLQHFPVGPLHNGYYHEIWGNDETQDGRDGHNMPFMIRTEDIPNPDGEVADYTVTIYFKSFITVEYSMSHLGGFNSPSTANPMAHHFRGKGGFSANAKFRHQFQSPTNQNPHWHGFGNLRWIGNLAGGASWAEISGNHLALSEFIFDSNFATVDESGKLQYNGPTTRSRKRAENNDDANNVKRKK